MAIRSLNILMVVDIAFDPPFDHDYSEYLELPDWESDRDVLATLREQGHTVKFFGVYENLEGLIHELNNNRPDLIFNLCEGYRQNRDLEPHLVALFELMGIPYTGAGSIALQLCKDKALSKKVLAFHDVKVPGFAVSKRKKPLKTLDLQFPAIIKPLGFEASEGISQASVVTNEIDALERVAFIHTRYETDAIIEEYIDGREIYVGVIGNKRCEVLPAREVFFDKIPDGELKFASYRAKWDEKYRKKWGIESGRADRFSEEVEASITRACKIVHELFHIRGYARIDFRVSLEGEVYFLEANPNPSIAREEDFALCASAGGYKYPDLIEKVIKLAMK